MEIGRIDVEQVPLLEISAFKFRADNFDDFLATFGKPLLVARLAHLGCELRQNVPIDERGKGNSARIALELKTAHLRAHGERLMESDPELVFVLQSHLRDEQCKLRKDVSDFQGFDPTVCR